MFSKNSVEPILGYLAVGVLVTAAVFMGALYVHAMVDIWEWGWNLL